MVDETPGNNQWRIEKRDIITGALVTAFETDGVVESNSSLDHDYVNSIAPGRETASNGPSRNPGTML